MQTFDVIVIGAGSGLHVADAAAEQKLKVAVIEAGPMGGTCLNRGCIPSKMVIHSADVMETIQNAEKFGIKVSGAKTNFAAITKRVSSIVDKDAKDIEDALMKDKNITLFKGTARFTGDYTLEVNKQKIKGKKIVIAAGTREFIPPVEGLESSGYITSTEALRLKNQPKHLIIIGGGYIAAEMAHFYGMMGTKITIFQRDKFMIPREDGEVAEAFTKAFSKKYEVITEASVNKVEKKGKNFVVHAGKKKVTGDQLLVATGRVPNTDILEVGKTAVKMSKRGFIEVDEYMETSQKNVYALGDIAGVYLFKHSANLEAQYVSHNLFSKKKSKVNYDAMPHAVFSSPQIAGVGMTEEQLVEKKIKYSVGRYEYIHTGMGAAIDEQDGFVKVLVDPKTNKILGCHIMGKDASTLIHEVLVAMRTEGTLSPIRRTVHIHPALNEVVQRAFFNIE